MKHLKTYKLFESVDKKINIKDIKLSELFNFDIGKISFKGLKKEDISKYPSSFWSWNTGRFYYPNVTDIDVFYNLFKIGDEVVINESVHYTNTPITSFKLYKINHKDKDDVGRMYSVENIGWVNTGEILSLYHLYPSLKDATDLGLL